VLVIAAAETPLGATEVGRVGVALRGVGGSRNQEVVAAPAVNSDPSLEILGS